MASEIVYDAKQLSFPKSIIEAPESPKKITSNFFDEREEYDAPPIRLRLGQCRGFQCPSSSTPHLSHVLHWRPLFLLRALFRALVAANPA